MIAPRKMGKKSKRRGLDGPRPLGWTEPKDGANQAPETRDPREYFGSIKAELSAAAASNPDATELPVGALDFMLECAVACDPDNPEVDGKLPTVDVDTLKAHLDDAQLATLPADWGPSAETLWMCARNDFSGEGMRVLLRTKNGTKNVNEWFADCGAAAITVACSRGNLAAARVLVDECARQGVSLDARKLNSRGTEGMYWACQARGNDHAVGSIEDFADLIELLVMRAGADLEHVFCNHPRPPHTALVRVAELGEPKLVARCLALGADVNRPSASVGGMTPLHMGCKSGVPKVVTALLAAGADTRATLPEGPHLPISYCMCSFNFAVADLVLKAEAERGLPPVSDETTRHVSCLDLIDEGVRKFRGEGDVTGGIAKRVFDLRTPTPAVKADREYSEQAAKRVVEKAAVKPPQACAACGEFSLSLRSCGRCWGIKYCSAQCQRTHWPLHKPGCAPKKKPTPGKTSHT